MSGFAKIWAWEQKNLTPTEKCVLMGLADFHTENGGCYPSLKRIAEKVNVSVDTVSRSIDNLIEKGLVKKEHRRKENNGHTSNFYDLLFTSILPPIPLPQIADTPSRNLSNEQQYIEQDTVPSELHDPLIAFSSNYEEPPVSEQAEFWAEAKVIFEGWRIPDKRANPLIGKLLKMSGGNYSEVRRLLEEAIANDVTDPVPWLIAAVSGKNKRGKEAKKKQIADAFAELEAASERRKAEWREQYGTEYGVYPDAGEGGGKHNELLQLEPPTESKPVHSERSKSVVKVPAKRVAQIVRPNRGDTNQGQIRPIHSGTGGGGGETNEAWQ